MYDLLRQRYFKNEWLNMINTERTFIHIMSDNKQDSVFALAKYIEKGLNLHHEFTETLNQREDVLQLPCGELCAITYCI